MAKKPETKELKTLAQRMQAVSPGSAIFGPGADNTAQAVDVLPTGVIQFDVATGIGGLPKGRIIEIYGSESSGKTTLALHFIAAAQKAGLEAAFIDAEHALDTVYAARLGVDVDSLTISQPDTGEHALQMTDTAVKCGAGIVVVDSVAALVPKAELDGDIGDSHVGLQARMMSQSMRKLTGSIGRSGCIVVFINQTRDKIGAYAGQTTSGGNALKFYSSIRISVTKGSGPIMYGGQQVGSTPKLKLVKNKLARPFVEAEVPLIYGAGFDRATSVVDLAVEHGIVDKSGSWFSYGDTKLGQGKQNAVEALRSEEGMLAEIEAKVLNELRAGGYLS